MKNILKSISVITIIISLTCIILANSGEKKIKKHQEFPDLVPIAKDLMVTADEFYNWHRYKDEGGPTFSGSSSWRRYMDFLEEKLKQFGVVDLQKNAWTYRRWFTSEWPDDSNWTLVSDGDPIRVAHYGAYSGSTGSNGMTAELIYYDPTTPPTSMQGKIVVFRLLPHPNPPLPENYKKYYTLSDYEYLSDAETFPPLFARVPASRAVYFDVWYQLRQLIRIRKTLTEGKALGGIVVFNMPYDQLAGLYTFPVPVLYHVPTLYVDRVAGEKLIEDAKQGKMATLTLVAKTEKAETYQLIGYLPGKYYGTERDKKIMLLTHTDGPSISQENGALGLLGIVAYFSRIPRDERPVTLMVFLDNRHYMPGLEEAFAGQDWFVKHPQARDSIIGLIAMEHLGQVEYRVSGDSFVATGLVEPSLLFTRNDPDLIAKAIKAVKEHNFPRVMVKCVERKGAHGRSQGLWYGLGSLALEWDLPAFTLMGTQGAYWATTARLDKFNKELFYTQVKTMTQLTAELMMKEKH